MSLFLLLYLAVTGMMGAYVLFRFGRAFGGGWRLAIPAVPAVAAVAGLPLLRLAGTFLSWEAARLVTLAVCGCLFLLFWIACAQLPLEAWNWLWRLAGVFRPAARRLCVPPKIGIAGCWLAAAAAMGAGLAEAERVRVTEVEIRSDRLAFDTPPLRIALISDLHLGRSSSPSFSCRIARLLADAKPDLLLCAGDLVDAGEPELRSQVEALAGVKAPLGKYAVVGNHEVYPGLETTLPLVEAAGFSVLRNNTQPVGAFWRVSGVDDPQADRLDAAAAGRNPEDWVLPRRRDQRFTLLLKHRPDLTEAAQKRADLQLSGHTHGGQIFPFTLILRRMYPFPEGELLPFEGGLRLYVSPGTGAWGVPVRLGVRPEITLITLRPVPMPGAALPDPALPALGNGGADDI